jgi:hypothetical protein
MHLVPFQNHDGISFYYPLWFSLREPSTVWEGMNWSKRHILSDEATPQTKGKIFGFHRSMDTLGAVLGPISCSTSTFILRITSTYSTLRSFGLLAIAATFFKGKTKNNYDR